MFRVGVTRDFLRPDGHSAASATSASTCSTRAGIAWEFLPDSGGEIPPEQARDYDGLLVLGPRVTAHTLEGVGRLKVVARFGVGYDNVDVPACTQAGVLLTITPEGVRRPVAVAALTLLLALSHKLLIKDRLTRAGRWAEKLDHIGQGITGRTLGILGLGNIGRELAEPGPTAGTDRWSATTPGSTADAAARVGVTLLPLDDLLRRSDFVCVCCALTPETRHLLDAERLALMKPTAYLINVARGPIVDQAALTTRPCSDGKIAGGGARRLRAGAHRRRRPVPGLDNVILAPHALCWTDECFALNGRAAVGSLIDVAAWLIPKHVVNRDALAHERLRHLRPRRGPMRDNR